MTDTTPDYAGLSRRLGALVYHILQTGTADGQDAQTCHEAAEALRTLLERNAALMRERTNLIETKREQIGRLQKERDALAAEVERLKEASDYNPGPLEVSVVGMPEFDALIDHIYEEGTNSEGVIPLANKLVRAAIQSHIGIRELLTERDALAAENERLKEDRARFPSKPDDIGRMIEAHIGNLKVGKKSAEDAADRALNRAFRAETTLTEKNNEIATLREALRGMSCSHPCNHRPSDWKVGLCFDAGECRCIAGVALAYNAGGNNSE